MPASIEIYIPYLIRPSRASQKCYPYSHKFTPDIGLKLAQSKPKVFPCHVHVLDSQLAKQAKKKSILVHIYVHTN